MRSVTAGLCSSGGGDRDAGYLYSGGRGREEHRCSSRRGAAGRGSDPAGHQRLYGTELWLPSEPGQRPGPASLHRRRRVGHGGVQVRQNQVFRCRPTNSQQVAKLRCDILT